MRYWWLPLTLVLTSIVNNWAYGNVPLTIGRGFDVVSRDGWAQRELLLIALVIAGSAVLQGLTGLARNFANEFLAQRVERDSREELYRSLLGKSQSFHAAQRVGDVMARSTNDVRALNMMWSPGLMLIIDSALAILVPLAMIVSMDVRFAVVPLVFLALLVLTVWDYNRRLEPVSRAQREAFGSMNTLLADAIGGIEVVKSNVQERYELDKFVGKARVFRDYFVKQGDIQARYWPMMAFAVCWGLALLHGLFLWRSGAVSLGQVVSFMGLFGTFRFATFISIFSFNLVQLGIASAARILAMITQRTSLDQNRGGHAATIDGRIEFRGVSFDFSGVADTAGREDNEGVLRDVSFTVEPGETIAIVGQTGAGKTTLTRLINRIFDVSAGSVLIDGVDVREWDLESLRGQISSIEQDIFLYSMTIAQNVAFGRPDASHEDIVHAAAQAQADEFIRSFRDGYETEIGERGVTLSGGQKQRIAIARAFLTDPRILILDDSTSAIDSRTEDQIQQAMRRIAGGRTTILITHRLSQIRHADRIVLLRRGRVLDVGGHEELLARSDAYRRIFAYV
ncbi:MAG: ABC transporter ATP-binding protein [Spirochaetaceae bacterium]|nr:MAG: ABC transporter ATP-binding protein [Spirochaetaceae bacterium]